MSRVNFCEQVQCPFWSEKGHGCERFATAHHCPLSKDLPPDIWHEGCLIDSHVTPYALSWSEECLPFEQLEAKLTWFLLCDRHYQQLVYLSESDQLDVQLPRRVDSGIFFRVVKVLPRLMPIVRDLLKENFPGWFLAKIEGESICTFRFPSADLIQFESYIKTLEEESEDE